MPFFSGVGLDLLQTQATAAGQEVANNKLNKFFADTNPQMAYMWEVELGGDTQEQVSTMARNTAIPTELIEQTTRYFCGVEYSWAGRDNSPRTFRVTFFDNQDFVVSQFIQNWMDLMRNGEDNKMAIPQTYFRNIVLKMKDVSDDVVTKRYEFIDCYPIEKSETSLAYESSELLTFDVIFKFRRRV